MLLVAVMPPKAKAKTKSPVAKEPAAVATVARRMVGKQIVYDIPRYCPRYQSPPPRERAQSSEPPSPQSPQPRERAQSSDDVANDHGKEIVANDHGKEIVAKQTVRAEKRTATVLTHEGLPKRARPAHHSGSASFKIMNSNHFLLKRKELTPGFSAHCGCDIHVNNKGRIYVTVLTHEGPAKGVEL